LTQRTSPFQLGTDTGVSSLVLGAFFSAWVKTDGVLRAWGDNGSGQLGNGTFTSSLVPVAVTSGFTSLAAGPGAAHLLGLKPDRTLWAWGANGSGQLGLGTVTHQPSPAQVATTFNFKAAARGASHSVAIRDDGSLWAWGANADGQLGLGTASRLFVPVPGP
ncbi:MAG: RCC1 repeat-containing protein, partial [Deltaproteobacteria bacterium]|nr:RCC1 repeat-containing protein [Deltaproteobacteria bacterium]